MLVWEKAANLVLVAAAAIAKWVAVIRVSVRPIRIRDDYHPRGRDNSYDVGPRIGRARREHRLNHVWAHALLVQINDVLGTDRLHPNGLIDVADDEARLDAGVRHGSNFGRGRGTGRHGPAQLSGDVGTVSSVDIFQARAHRCIRRSRRVPAERPWSATSGGRNARQ